MTVLDSFTPAICVSVPPEKLGAWLREFYATSESLPDDFLSERDDTLPQQRDWG